MNERWFFTDVAKKHALVESCIFEGGLAFRALDAAFRDPSLVTRPSREAAHALADELRADGLHVVPIMLLGEGRPRGQGGLDVEPGPAARSAPPLPPSTCSGCGRLTRPNERITRPAGARGYGGPTWMHASCPGPAGSVDPRLTATWLSLLRSGMGSLVLGGIEAELDERPGCHPAEWMLAWAHYWIDEGESEKAAAVLEEVIS